MKTKFAFLILIIFFYSLAPSHGGEPNSFDQKFNTLQKSMALPDVKNLLGPPDLRELKGDLETWHYNQNGGRIVIFDKSGIVEFGREQNPSVSQTPVEPILVNLDIGQACKEDKQCTSQNCHFHICSGKNNCAVPIGKICAVNSDCCTGLCDFGKCKKP